MFHVEHGWAAASNWVEDCPMLRRLLFLIAVVLSFVALPVLVFAQGAAPGEATIPGPITLTDTAVQVAIAGAITWLIETLKRWKAFPWMTPDSGTLNRIVAIALAGVATIGIHASFEPEAGTLIITGLNYTAIVGGAWEWFKTFVFQELVYRGAIKPGQDLAEIKRSLDR